MGLLGEQFGGLLDTDMDADHVERQPELLARHGAAVVEVVHLERREQRSEAAPVGPAGRVSPDGFPDE